MGLRFRRLLTDARRLSAGEYSTETASGLIAICCPACSDISELPEERNPRPGTDFVPLRWMCESQACSFCDFVSLESWTERAA